MFGMIIFFVIHKDSYVNDFYAFLPTSITIISHSRPSLYFSALILSVLYLSVGFILNNYQMRQALQEGIAWDYDRERRVKEIQAPLERCYDLPPVC